MALSTYRPRASRYRNVWDFRCPSYFECCVVEAPASRKVHAALHFRNSCKFSPCNHNAGTADQRHDPKQTFSTHTGDNNVIKGLGYSRNRRVSGQRLRLLFPQISMSADCDVLAFSKAGTFLFSATKKTAEECPLKSREASARPKRISSYLTNSEKLVA